MLVGHTLYELSNLKWEIENVQIIQLLLVTKKTIPNSFGGFDFDKEDWWAEKKIN